MAGNKPKKDASHVLMSERERTLASAIRKRASNIQFLERAFEQTGCSCSPHRLQLKEVEAQHDAERDRLLDELDNSDLAKEIRRLKKTIFEIDAREHHSLDLSARQAQPFLPLWMLDQVREGNPDILGLSNQDIATSYAEAWYSGWRPKSLYKTKTPQNPKVARPERLN